MTPRRVQTLMTALLLMLAASVMQAGGWVVITTEHLPDFVVAGKPTTLTYAVRQHGHKLVDGLAGRVEARGAGTVVTALATTASENGRYLVTLTLPAAGSWTIAIDSGFGGNYSSSRFTLQALDAGASAPTVTQAERGQQLFAAKGCAMCHAHPAFNGPGVSVGPPLAAKRYQPEYVKQVLAHPPQERADRWQMPDLGLRDDEIRPLVAFITAKRSDGRLTAASKR